MQPLLFLEKVFAYLQGKGYGAKTIEKEVSLALKLLGRTPRTVLDIGANKGLWMGRLLSFHPDTIVHAFEPQPACNRELQRLYGDKKNVHLHPKAVSNKNEIMSLYFDEEGSGLASLSARQLDHFGISLSHSIPVESIVLDEFLDQIGVNAIDIIKIDVEGHELAVFDGMKILLGSKAPPMVIQFEFGGCNIDTRTFFADFYSLLSNKYQFYRQTPFGLNRIDRYSEADECFRTTNFFLNLK